MANAWGNNRGFFGATAIIGTLGLGPSLSATQYTTPQLMAGAVDFAFACDGFQGTSIGLGADSNAYVWGNNGYGALWTGTTDTSAHSTPALVSAIGSTIKKVRAGAFDSYALTISGDLWGCGDGGQGQLGVDTSNHYSGVLMHSGVADFDVGTSHVVALLNTGHVITCGDNSYGEAGQGGGLLASNLWGDVTPASSSTPTAVFAGWNYSFILMADGTIYGCGCIDFGTLGPNFATTGIAGPSFQATFALTGLPSTTVEISVNGASNPGYANTYAYGTTYVRLNDGTVWACGTNSPAGYFGNGSTSTPAYSNTVQQVSLPVGVTAVSLMQGAGQARHMGLVGSDGNIYLWGDGGAGEMGNGTTTANNPTPLTGSGLTAKTWLGGGLGQVYAGVNSFTPSAHPRSYAQVIG